MSSLFRTKVGGSIAQGTSGLETGAIGEEEDESKFIEKGWPPYRK